ncbi:DUF262 domain-containing protein [bacterium]|nr:DUF262 domain-containing protein [bacterium]
MKLVTWNEDREITVEEVQGLAGRLGIPHFQRGLVWGPDSIAALLESLFHGTPCGSFVFWKCDQKSENGPPLVDGASKDISYFVVDGQQRIRSLYSIGNDEAIWESDNAEDASDPDQPESKGRKKVWCVNLTRIEGFSKLLRAHGKEYSMFLFAVDPTRADKRSPIRTNILPIQLFEEHATWESLRDYHKCIVHGDGLSPADSDFADLYATLRARILAVRQKKFFVSIIETNDVSDVVALYNRINSGGKRVETEERAFAKLVALQPSTWPELADVFAAVHRREGPESAAVAIQRDDVLRRGQERSFGFKLFIRVFLQVCHHHFGYSLGKSSFSFDIAKKESFLRRLRDLTDAQARSLWDETKEVLVLVCELLRSPLCCDDFRFLPDTQNLTPVFQLLISYPTLREQKFHPILASLCLRLFLAQIDAKTLARAVYDAADPDKNAFDVIPPLIQAADARLAKDLARSIEAASSIQDRYVLLLYWLVRRNNARDFSYTNVPESRRPAHAEVRIDANAKPEKQHMVPFSRLVKVLNDDDAQRGGTHPFNNIGNLTYISKELNSYETGLGDVMAPLTGESEANRKAHFLWEDPAASVSDKAYKELLALLGDGAPEPNEAEVSATFDRFCKDRRERIHGGFRAWLEDLDRAACAAHALKDFSHLGELAKAKDRVEPQRPQFVDELRLPASHLIRGFDLDDDVESILIRLASRSRSGFKFKAGGLRIQLTKGKSVCLQVSTDRLVLELDGRIAPDHRAFIVRFLGVESLEVPLVHAGSVQLATIEKLPALADELARIEDQIRAGIEARRGGRAERSAGSVDKNKTWTEAQFLAAVEAKQGQGGATRKLVDRLILFGREFDPGVDPFRSRSKEGSAIFNIGEIGLFTLYPKDLYIRVLRNLKRHGAPETAAEWEEVINRLNACGLGVFSNKDLGHARVVEKRLAGMTDDDLDRFMRFVSWFVDGARSRVARSSVD